MAPQGYLLASKNHQLGTLRRFVRDMRAHLERRKTNADADLIRTSRGPVLQAVLGLRDFLRSESLGNVFRSLGLFMGAWVWYVINTNTYMPPDYDD